VLIRIREKFVTGAPVVTAIVLPAAAVAGAATIVGRVRALPSAFSRYGSENFSVQMVGRAVAAQPATTDENPAIRDQQGYAVIRDNDIHVDLTVCIGR
jgi:hypothetical protein